MTAAWAVGRAASRAGTGGAGRECIHTHRSQRCSDGSRERGRKGDVQHGVHGPQVCDAPGGRRRRRYERGAAGLPTAIPAAGQRGGAAIGRSPAGQVRGREASCSSGHVGAGGLGTGGSGVQWHRRASRQARSGTQVGRPRQAGRGRAGRRGARMRLRQEQGQEQVCGWRLQAARVTR